MMRDVRLGSAACEADITHVSLTCGPDSSLNTANKSNKHTDDPNLNDMVLLVETILQQKKTKLLIVEDVVGTCMEYSDVAVPTSVRMARAENISLGFFPNHVQDSGRAAREGAREAPRFGKQEEGKGAQEEECATPQEEEPSTPGGATACRVV